MAADPSISIALEHAVMMSLDSIEHCEMAGISVIEGGELRTIATTDEAVLRADQLQAQQKEGPCYGAARTHEVVIVDDAGSDPRWPSFGPRLVDETGLRASLSLLLYATDESHARLTLYGQETNAFSTEDVVAGQVLAARAAAAVAAAASDAHLQRALRTRTIIGQATGILIERFGVAPDQAFAVLRRISQNHNIKLAGLAEHLVETGVLIEAERQGSPRADGARDPVEMKNGRRTSSDSVDAPRRQPSRVLGSDDVLGHGGDRLPIAGDALDE